MRNDFATLTSGPWWAAITSDLVVWFIVMLRWGWALGHHVGHLHTLILRCNCPQQVEIGTLVARNTAAPAILASPPSAAGAAAISRASSTIAVMPTGVVLRHTPSTRALHVSPAAPSQPVASVAALASTPVHELRQLLEALDAVVPESLDEHAYLQQQRDLLLCQISEPQQPHPQLRFPHPQVHTHHVSMIGLFLPLAHAQPRLEPRPHLPRVQPQSRRLPIQTDGGALPLGHKHRHQEQRHPRQQLHQRHRVGLVKRNMCHQPKRSTISGSDIHRTAIAAALPSLRSQGQSRST